MERVRPAGTGVFGHFLAAQETSPTVTLAHAGLSDDGALEIAYFLAASRHLKRLDLTGNNLSSTGVFHLAKAIKQSLILKHNRIGEFGEAGLGTLCRALYDNNTLRHLDLRHAGLQGASAASIIGEMLRHNSYLSHLELSWNPLEIAGGQVLYESVQANTTLFDCQLTGCRVADETLLAIAELLLRNRKAKGADLQSGRYQACIDFDPTALRNLGGQMTESQMLECRNQAGVKTRLEEMATDLNIGADIPRELAPNNLVVSNEATNDFMIQLTRYMNSSISNLKDSALAHEMYDYLDGAYKELAQDRGCIEGIHRHLTALSEGFRDRELRSRESISEGQNKLLEFNREIMTFRHMLERLSEELGVSRELNSQIWHDRQTAEEQASAEEGSLKNTLATIMAEKRELEKRLTSLQETCQKQEADNAEMRRRMTRLRQGVTLLHEPSEAGHFQTMQPVKGI